MQNVREQDNVIITSKIICVPVAGTSAYTVLHVRPNSTYSLLRLTWVNRSSIVNLVRIRTTYVRQLFEVSTMSTGHQVAMALRAAYLSMHRQADAILSCSSIRLSCSPAGPPASRHV